LHNTSLTNLYALMKYQ